MTEREETANDTGKMEMGLRKNRKIRITHNVLLSFYLYLFSRVLWREKPCCPGTGEAKSNRILDQGNGETDPLAGTPYSLD